MKFVCPPILDSPLWLRYDAMVNHRGPGRPALLEHPLHAEFESSICESKDLIIALVELSLEIDGSTASAARTIKLDVIAQKLAEKAREIASIQLEKAKQS